MIKMEHYQAIKAQGAINLTCLKAKQKLEKLKEEHRVSQLFHTTSLAILEATLAD